MLKREKIIIALICTLFLAIVFSTDVKAATATISASSTNIKVGEKVTITTTIKGAAWQISLSGAVSESYADNTDDAEDTTLTKTTTFTPTSAGTYSVNLSGNVTGSNDTSSTPVSGSVKINVEEKANEKPSDTNTTPPSTTTNTPSSNTNTTKDTPANNNTTVANTTTPKKETTTFKSVNETMYTQSRVNLRTNYGTDSDIVTTLPEGTELTRIGYSTSNVNGYSWSKVTYKGKTYYCISKSLTNTKPEEPKENSSEQNENNNVSNEQENNVNNEVTNEISATAQVETTENNDADLIKLEVEGYTLTPSFDPNVYEYNLDVPNDTSSLNIQTEGANSNVKIEVAGNTEIKEESVITIIVHNNETKKDTTYQIIVNKVAGDPATVNAIMKATKKKEQIEKILIIGAFVLILACIILYKITKKDLAENQDDDDNYKEKEQNDIRSKERKSEKDNNERRKEKNTKEEYLTENKSETAERKVVHKKTHNKVEDTSNDLKKENRRSTEKEKVMMVKTSGNNRNDDFEEKLEKIKRKQDRDKRGKHF